jgi:hypothetical protein
MTITANAFPRQRTVYSVDLLLLSLEIQVETLSIPS